MASLCVHKYVRYICLVCRRALCVLTFFVDIELEYSCIVRAHVHVYLWYVRVCVD